jgi:hypothetical protein
MFVEWLPLIYFLIFAIPAVVAHVKGRSFWLWLFYGFLLWPVAMVHAILMGAFKKCVACAELIKQEAVLCRYCSTDQPAFVSDGTVEVYKEQSISEIPEGYRALNARFESVADAKSYIDNNPSLHR